MRAAPFAAVSIAILFAAPASAHATVATWDNDDLDPMTLLWLGECIYGADSFSSASPLPSGAIHGQAAGTGTAPIGTFALQAYDTVYEKQAGPFVPEVGCAGSWHFTLMESGGEATIYLAAGVAPRLLTVSVAFSSVFAFASAAGELVEGDCSVGGVVAPVNPADGTCTLTFWGAAGTAHVLLFHAEASTSSTTAAAGWSVPVQATVEVAEGTHATVFDLVHVV